MRPLDIIIPTWNNPEFLNPCVQSIVRTGILREDARLLIVNNGTQDINGFCGQVPNVEVLNPGRNLGWEGGLQHALERSDAKFVCFQNDDTHLPQSSALFYQKLLIPFVDKNVAAVGPITTTAAGAQSIFHPHSPRTRVETSYLIFFTVMIRRSDLDAAGGIDTTLPGGDDFDLSMRFRAAGKKLMIDPSAFIIHHGFKTGTRVRGDHTTAGGWNSPQMQERTNHALIKKHGFKAFISAFSGVVPDVPKPSIDLEGELCAKYAEDAKLVLELGCGARKTVPHAVGVDQAAKGEDPTHIEGKSVADVQADVTKRLPFDPLSQDCIIARHILEHCIDTVGVLKEWNRVLKVGGRIVIAVPDEAVTASIPMNPEHCHAFTEESLANLLDLCGFQKLASSSSHNGVSFVGSFEKVLHMGPVEDLRMGCNHPGEVCVA